jgi:hypothetical protein
MSLAAAKTVQTFSRLQCPKLRIPTTAKILVCRKQRTVIQGASLNVLDELCNLENPITLWMSYLQSMFLAFNSSLKSLHLSRAPNPCLQPGHDSNVPDEKMRASSV